MRCMRCHVAESGMLRVLAIYRQVQRGSCRIFLSCVTKVTRAIRGTLIRTADLSGDLASTHNLARSHAQNPVTARHDMIACPWSSRSGPAAPHSLGSCSWSEPDAFGSCSRRHYHESWSSRHLSSCARLPMAHAPLHFRRFPTDDHRLAARVHLKHAH